MLKTFNAQKFIEEVTKKAEELIQKAKDKVPCFSNKSNGPCLSGIYDLTTVKTFYGQNFFKNEMGKDGYTNFVEDAHPIIKERIKA